MHPLLPARIRSLRPVIAGLLAGFFLLLTLASGFHRLHGQLHSPAEHDHSPCAICTIAKGQLDTPVVSVSEVFASLSVAWTLPAVQVIVPAAIDLSSAPGRGPPASVSSQS